MASFPDLRPQRRSASAESRAVRSSRRFVLLLAGFVAALSVVAFLAVSELATLRGAKASVRTPVFLTQALRSSDPAASPVRKPAPGTGDRKGALA
jgi:hypothetical protein